jgi:hypothetical protein
MLQNGVHFQWIDEIIAKLSITLKDQSEDWNVRLQGLKSLQNCCRKLNEQQEKEYFAKLMALKLQDGMISQVYIPF